ncbi:tetratricopeptide (TPR) repeat protein [Allocatelliglobosispora scoriae]|uniref:Tetratricopeptide (TPR) repeat protein n=1 Tax=Allocatelliglobosispora scoriae TaxID=643052 RepID=A0A841C293_9ACTN|nr:tetratricopeptide repeat protein [Allocatelliglobosispora scoriae]MBB5874006.1 tetratricopeptide (TPR) repeat protein [Allocatelliglobosispora scoriae]
MSVDERLLRAREHYELAVFGGDRGMLARADHELDGVEADLALARGRILHARFLEHRDLEDPRELALFERAAHLYHHLDDVRGEAEAHFWIGCVHQVVRQDDEAAVPALRRSRELAAQAGDKLTLSYALRHLGYAEHRAGRLPEARALLEESTELRRELGFSAGVAANLVGLAYVATAQDRRDDASALLDEAEALAASSGAHGIQPMITEARSTRS